MTYTCATLNGIDDGVPWLNSPMTHPPMPKDATFAGTKELSAKESTIINSTLVHVDHKTLYVYKLENFNVHNIYILIKFMENCNQV